MKYCFECRECNSKEYKEVYQGFNILNDSSSVRFMLKESYLLTSDKLVLYRVDERADINCVVKVSSHRKPQKINRDFNKASSKKQKKTNDGEDRIDQVKEVIQQ